MGRLAPVQPEAQGKARRAARAGSPGKRRNTALRLGLHRPCGWSLQTAARRVARHAQAASLGCAARLAGGRLQSHASLPIAL